MNEQDFEKKFWNNYRIEISNRSGFTRVYKDEELCVNLINEEAAIEYIAKDAKIDHESIFFVSEEPSRIVIFESGEEFYACEQVMVKNVWVDKEGNRVNVMHADGTVPTYEEFLSAKKYDQNTKIFAASGDQNPNSIKL